MIDRNQSFEEKTIMRSLAPLAPMPVLAACAPPTTVDRYNPVEGSRVFTLSVDGRAVRASRGTFAHRTQDFELCHFLTDLDFALHDLDDAPGVFNAVIAEVCEGLVIGGIHFGTEERRGKLHLTYTSDLLPGVGPLTSKLDVGPPPWLAPELRTWVHLPIHDRYGGALPRLPVVRLE